MFLQYITSLLGRKMYINLDDAMCNIASPHVSQPVNSVMSTGNATVLIQTCLVIVYVSFVPDILLPCSIDCLDCCRTWVLISYSFVNNTQRFFLQAVTNNLHFFTSYPAPSSSIPTVFPLLSQTHVMRLLKMKSPLSCPSTLNLARERNQLHKHQRGKVEAKLFLRHTQKLGPKLGLKRQPHPHQERSVWTIGKFKT